MQKLVILILFTSLLGGTAFKMAGLELAWKVKNEAYFVKFTGKKVKGVFKGLKTDIVFDENALAQSHIFATIQTETVATGNFLKNRHARSGLGSKEYPLITFQSTKIVKTGTAFEAQGKLTIKDVTKNITLPFTFTKTQEGGIFAGSFSIVPQDYHVDRSGTPEKLDIEINVPVIR